MIIDSTVAICANRHGNCLFDTWRSVKSFTKSGEMLVDNRHSHGTGYHSSGKFLDAMALDDLPSKTLEVEGYMRLMYAAAVGYNLETPPPKP